MGGSRGETWREPDRRGSAPQPEAKGASLAFFQAARTRRAPAGPMRGSLVLFAKGTLSVAMALLLLVGGCARGESSAVATNPASTEVPTEVPTETPIERPTATDTPAPTPQLAAVSPNQVPASQDSVTVYVRGQSIGREPYLFLAHPTYGEVEGEDVKVYPGGCKARCAFDISAAKPGRWSVQVINLDGGQAELVDAFEVLPPTATPTASSTPSPTPTATTVIVMPTHTSTPTPTSTSTPKPRPKKREPTAIPTLPPPSSQP